MPKRWNVERAETTNTHHTDRSFCQRESLLDLRCCDYRAESLLEAKAWSVKEMRVLRWSLARGVRALPVAHSQLGEKCR